MKYLRRISAKWEFHHVFFLKKHGIEVKQGNDTFGIEEGSSYFDILSGIEDAQDLKDRRTSIVFDEAEYLPHSMFMLRGGYPASGYPYGKEAITFKQDIFGGYCSQCLLPTNEQYQPFVLKNEPEISKKDLFFTLHWAHNYLFTDKERFATHFEKWGLTCREVYVGKAKQLSQNIVQIVLPMSTSPLEFGNSDFGQTFDPEYSGKIGNYPTCSVCQRPNYSNQVRDYFPAFKEPQDFDIMHTCEWFEYFHHIVISRPFAEFLISHNTIKWSSEYLIPIKPFIG